MIPRWHAYRSATKLCWSVIRIGTGGVKRQSVCNKLVCPHFMRLRDCVGDLSVVSITEGPDEHSAEAIDMRLKISEQRGAS